MRSTPLFLSILLLAVSVPGLATNSDLTAAESSLKPPKVCNYRAKGDLEKLQYEALADFANLFVVKQDVRTAFDRYVPGEYKQHSPLAEQGREFAIEFLSKSFAEGVKTGNLTIFGGHGYGIMHYRMQLPTITFAVVDYFKFRGNCIVEHWDVLQQITGNETNPIAYF